MKDLRKAQTCASCNHLFFVHHIGIDAEPACDDGGWSEFIDDMLSNDTDLYDTVTDYTEVVCDGWTPRIKTCGTCTHFDCRKETCAKDDSGEKIDPNDPHDCEIWVLDGSDEL